MNVLVIGSGGREDAICHLFSKSRVVEGLYCAPGNAGISRAAECVAIKHDEIEKLADFASVKSIDLTFAGGETPLALGIVDEFESRGLKIIGPTRAASQLESSKAFAKDFMARHSVPTAEYFAAESISSAIAELESGRFGNAASPVVVKADGLAAGKGVVVANDRAQAIAAINDMADLVGAAAASTIVLEECLFGKEVSLIMFADGEDFALMPPTRDHKRIGEGDTGPNTGGMGTITDASLLSPDELDNIVETVIRPTLKGCVAEGFPFRGILFLGLMMTAGETPVATRLPKLLEYNVRFGDPETQAILVRLETDLADICGAMLDGTLGSLDIKWRQGSSACVVLASEGYPSKPRTGDRITGIDDANDIPNVTVFHAGTSAADDGGFLTAGGRVLGVTATGNNVSDALAAAYSAVEKISWPGMQYRRDIGQ
ncbi:MAG: phosphoribosylamine--glycine ligase [Pyrinomonadaceae bacterium]